MDIAHLTPLLLGAAAMLICACGCSTSKTVSATNPGEPVGDPQQLLQSHRGKILLLLLGRESCGGTVKATAVLDDYAPTSPPNVSILRVDIPLPGEDLKVAPWSHPFPRKVDHGRRLAEYLEFFYYPTFYVFDRDGDLRYTGGCDAQKVKTIIADLLAEQPGQPKKSYTLPMPAIGAAAPPISAMTLSGDPVTLDSLRGPRGTLLIFTRTACRFTLEALPTMQTLADDHRQSGIAVAIINNAEPKDKIAPIYAQHTPHVPVIHDPTGQISQAYGVDVTPFYFLLDPTGKILAHRSYTPAAASNSIRQLLGQTTPPPRFKPTEAG